MSKRWDKKILREVERTGVEAHIEYVDGLGGWVVRVGRARLNSYSFRQAQKIAFDVLAGLSDREAPRLVAYRDPLGGPTQATEAGETA